MRGKVVRCLAAVQDRGGHRDSGAYFAPRGRNAAGAGGQRAETVAEGRAAVPAAPAAELLSALPVSWFPFDVTHSTGVPLGFLLTLQRRTDAATLAEVCLAYQPRAL